MSNRWSKKTENTVQDFDGEECNIDEIVGALNYYQKKVYSLTKENEELKKENNLLKIALCYTLEDMGSSYHIDLFEEIFNFRFYELIGRAYDIEWEDLLNEEN